MLLNEFPLTSFSLLERWCISHEEKEEISKDDILMIDEMCSQKSLDYWASSKLAPTHSDPLRSTPTHSEPLYDTYIDSL